ncbi:MAG: lysophospholipid acyltransferase family protein [Lentisphaeria bacterium]|nr:lysophospholipid acyltransferase family protein [Lentisphaeria bacterium]
MFTLKNKRHMPVWLAWLLARLVGLYAWTFRVRYDDPDGWLQRRVPWPVVVPVWHNRICFLATVFPQALLERAAVLISASRDGEYISTLIRFFRLDVVRGSSSRGGMQALRAMLQKLKHGQTMVVTVDGPRGPRYTVHPGIVALATLGRVPVLPVAVNAEKFWQLNSWDGTQIPKPFSRVLVRLGRPFHLPEGVDREAGVTAIREALLEITDDRGAGSSRKS